MVVKVCNSAINLKNSRVVCIIVKTYSFPLLSVNPPTEDRPSFCIDIDINKITDDAARSRMCESGIKRGRLKVGT